MAIGTITVVQKSQAEGGINADLISFAGDGAYPTGGTAAFQATVRAALDKGNVTILAVIGQDCGGYVPVYDKTNDKLKLYMGDNNNAADGPFVEVANAADLAAVPFAVLVLSH